MNKEKAVSLVLAVITALLLASIGIFIAEQSWIGIILALLGTFATVGLGMSLKRRRNSRNSR